MKKKLIICLVSLFTLVNTKAQLADNFNDGDYTANPSWAGSLTDWIVNPAFQLQSNNTVLNSTFFISTPSTLATTAQWEFYCQLTFNPSGANYADVFLTASAADLSQSSTTGYFVRLGNTTDEISLYRKDAGTSIKLIDGTDGILNTSNNTVKIKVVRDATNSWTLSRDITGTGSSYFTEGVVTDATYITSAFFGISIKQSTASFFQRHFFDDILVMPYVPDIIPPVLQTITAIGPNTLDVLFNEPIDLTSGTTIANYSVSNGLGAPVTAIRDPVNLSLVHLTFAGSFPPRTNLTLTINGVKDIAGNSIVPSTGVFSYFTALQYDVVIDELMADPTPLVGLPDIEWLELKNTTAFDIDLQGWRVGKSTGVSGPMQPYILRPDSFVIICTSSAVAALSVFGPTISVTSFPSLNNTGDLLFLQSAQGTLIHAVNYTDAWYQNELKMGGGWTLEMIDTHNPCSGFNNWKASEDPKGGTPGKRNSIDALNPDQSVPKLIRAYAIDSLNIVLVFNESLDSTTASLISNYSISDGISSPVIAAPLSPLFERVLLTLPAASPLLRNKIYTVTANSLSDCTGNAIGASNVARVGLYEHTDNFDLIVNEILFNPFSNSNDYVELYNRSNKILDLKNVYIANRNTSGAISSIEQLATDDYLFFPGDFIVVTESRSLVLNRYVANNPDAFIEVGTMPSFNDDAGDVVIINEQGNIIDEVAYLDDWHFKLITNKEGVALERIDYDAPSQDPQNWHSAATNVGYGTPTYKNSQYRKNGGVEGEITVTPDIFSPDNDGMDDVATINYQFPSPGYVANITVFDAAGRPVRFLQRNALNGLKGYYRWDGLNDKNQKLPVGMYIIYTEVFNLQGKTKKFKNVIVLARRN